MTKPLHEAYYKHQIEEIKKSFDLNSGVAVDSLSDLETWSIKEAKDYYLDEIIMVRKNAERLFKMISEDLEEEIYRAEEENTDGPKDHAEEPDLYFLSLDEK